MRFEFDRPNGAQADCWATCDVATAGGPQRASIDGFRLDREYGTFSGQANFEPPHPLGVHGGTGTCFGR